MNTALVNVAENLAAEFPNSSTTTVLRIVTECAAEFPTADLLFLHNAARARLADDATRPPRQD